MLTDWIHWLSSVHPDELPVLLAPILLLDVSRYAVGSVVVCLWDYGRAVARAVRGKAQERGFRHCPSVCAVVTALNEGETIGQTLRSIWGTYPRLEVIVVDDGSTDETNEVARRFAREHPDVLVLRKPQRGGKSSAVNYALPFTRAEIILCIDGDSDLDSAAIWESVQPFADPRIGAVSCTVLARNPFDALVTWLQAFEYLQCIFVGRIFSARLNILGVVSGAFGAFRRSALQRVMGWDVGPGEDSDLTLRLRKWGYKIAFAPYAQCFTNLPTSWWQLFRQRRRWDWACVTFECRKHVDMANLFSPNFRFSNFCLLLDRWVFNVLMTFAVWAYLAWLCLDAQPDTGKQLFLYYLVYLGLALVQLGAVMFYSTHRRRDAVIGLAAPLMPFYHLILRGVSLVALTEEILTRRSFRDSFVPAHVREATWHW